MLGWWDIGGEIMTDEPILLPCPFCGAPARDDLLPHSGGPGWVQCSACDIDQSMSDTLEEAVRRWNSRAPSVHSKLVYALKEARDAIAVHKLSPYAATLIDEALDNLKETSS
jgi:hypothetical protein